MLYNKELKRTITIIDCLECKCYNRRKKQCEGLGIVCNEIDPLTNTLIDSVTGLPINIDNNENEVKDGKD